MLLCSVRWQSTLIEIYLYPNNIIALRNKFPSPTTRKWVLSKKPLEEKVIIFVLFQVVDLFLKSDLFLSFYVKTVIKYMSQAPE